MTDKAEVRKGVATSLTRSDDMKHRDPFKNPFSTKETRVFVRWFTGVFLLAIWVIAVYLAIHNSMLMPTLVNEADWSSARFAVESYLPLLIVLVLTFLWNRFTGRD